jgi:hypothetical protein
VVTVVAKARIKPARAASIVGVIIVTKAVKPTITPDKRLKRTESHLLTTQELNAEELDCEHFHAYLPTSNSMGLYSNIFNQIPFLKSDSCDSTVSTIFNISRKNFEDAPKARRIVTPEIVSPYIEYRGDRVTESEDVKTTVDQPTKVTYPTVAGPERFGHKPVLDDGSSLFGVKVCAIAAHFRNLWGEIFRTLAVVHLRVTHRSSIASR